MHIASFSGWLLSNIKGVKHIQDQFLQLVAEIGSGFILIGQPNNKTNFDELTHFLKYTVQQSKAFFTFFPSQCQQRWQDFNLWPCNTVQPPIVNIAKTFQIQTKDIIKFKTIYILFLLKLIYNIKLGRYVMFENVPRFN